MKRAGQSVYFAIAALIFLGFFYPGVTREFTTLLDVGFVADLWVFVASQPPLLLSDSNIPA